jgi:hypothetical protein
MNRSLLAVALVAAAGCSPEFDPASRIEKLRVLAVQAEPPEIDPAETASLTSLVLRPDFASAPSRITTVVHLACVPVPGDPAPTPCVLLANLEEPAEEIGAIARAGCDGGAGAAWPPVVLAGFEACDASGCGPASAGGAPLAPALLAVPPAFAFPDTGPERILGVDAIDLAFAIDATPDELAVGVGSTCPAGDVAGNLAALWSGREHVVAVKRVVIAGPDAPAGERNHNPALGGILADGVPLDPAGTPSLGTARVALAPAPAVGPGGEPETYTKLDAAGVPIETATEDWIYSWFATAGELDELHTRGGQTDRWTGKGASGTVRFVVVVRDLRGGVAWAVRDVGVP